MIMRHGARTSMFNIRGVPHAPVSCRFRDQFNKTFVLARTKEKWKRNFKNFGFRDYLMYPQSDQCQGSALTPYGMQQHITTGAYLRSRYGNILNLTQVHVRSTSTSRTYQSAVAVLHGLLDPDDFQKVQIFKSASTSFCSEKLSSVSCSCPSANQYLSKAKKLASQFERNDQFKRDMLDDIMASLLVQIGDDILTFNIIDVTMTYVCHNIRFLCPLSQRNCLSKSHMKDLFQMQDKIGRFMVTRNPDYIKFVHLFLHPLLMEMATRMIKATRSDHKKPFVLYSGHDITVTPLATVLGFNEGKWPPFASRIVIELYRKNDVKKHYFLKFFYNGKDVTSSVVFCRNKILQGFCKLKYFLDFVKNHIEDIGLGSYIDSCG